MTYNINNCGPEIQNQGNNQGQGQGQGQGQEPKKDSLVKWEYALPAGVGVAGLVATPFLLGAFGGKIKRTPRKTKKTKKTKKLRKNKKSNKNKSFMRR